MQILATIFITQAMMIHYSNAISANKNIKKVLNEHSLTGS